MGHQIGKTSIFVSSMFPKIGITTSPLELFPLTQGVFHINLALASKPCWQTHEILLLGRIASEEMNHFGGMKNICTSYPRKETKLGCLRNSQEEKSCIFYNVSKARFYYFWTANSFLLDLNRCMEPIWEYIREAFVIEIVIELILISDYMGPVEESAKQTGTHLVLQGQSWGQFSFWI